MRVWLILDEQGGDAAGLEALVRRWAAAPDNAHWLVESRRAGPGLGAAVRAHRPEILVLADEACPAGPWLEELLALDTGVVVATAPDRAAPYLALAERFPVYPVPVPATAPAVGLAVLAALAGLRRQRDWRARFEEAQQRLEDRIVIERAKGLLVRSLGVAEEEAYKRLRVLSRRQRRPIRAIAQAVLDAGALLQPGEGDVPAEAGAAGPPAPERVLPGV